MVLLNYYQSCILLIISTAVLTNCQVEGETLPGGLPNECRRFADDPPDSQNASMWCQLLPSFEEMPRGVVQQLSYLLFVQCGFINIPRNSLTMLHQLQKLAIDCDLTESSVHLSVDDGSFSTLDQLQSVSITRSNLLSLPNGTFCHMIALDDVDFSNNSISRLEDTGLLCSEVCLGESNDIVPCHPSDLGICGVVPRKLSKLKLDGNNITVLKDYGIPCQLSNLQRLSLSDNKIATVEPSALTFLTNLEILKLDGNLLEELPDDVFENTSLGTLNLQNNFLQNIPTSIGFQSNLSSLDLQQNKIQKIAANTFRGLYKLFELNLSSNRLTYIEPGAFTSQSSLYTLYLNNNSLGTLSSDTLDGLTALTRLYLQDNLFTTVANDTFHDLVQLQRLDLSNNFLESIPNFSYMNELRILKLTSNSIKVIHDHAFNNCAKLYELFLNHNHIHSVSNVFAGLTNLNKLDLAYNEIEYIQNNSFKSLLELQYLFLQHNKLTLEENVYHENGTVQMNVFALDKMEILNLSSNHLLRFSYGWFPDSLLELYLQNNSISEVDVENTGCFHRPEMILVQPGKTRRVCPGLPYILILDLSYNSLRHIRARSFPTTLNLIVLDHNLIETIEDGAFGEFTDIKTISLHNNRMHTLAELTNTRYHLTEYKAVLTLADNPWLCNCDLYWLKLRDVNSFFTVTDFDKLVCERLFHRGIARNVRISDANSIEDFMCLFKDLSSRVDWCPKKGKIRVCKEKCPKECKCYQSAIKVLSKMQVRTKIINTDCSQGNLSTVPEGIPLETATLFLDANNIMVIGFSNFTWHRSLVKLYLNNSNVEVIEDCAFSNAVQLQLLVLKNNRLADIPPDLFHNLSALRELDLSHNFLSNLSFSLFQSLPSLKTLYLHDNRLSVFPVWSRFEQLPSLARVSLHHNPFSCECEYAQQFSIWLSNNTNKVVNVRDLRCNESDDGLDSMSLIAYNASHCYPSSVSIIKERYVPILVGSLCAFVLLSVATVLIFIYRHEMQVLIYSHYGVRLFLGNDDDEAEKVFDAFVSYSSRDEMFLVEDLIPGLEHIDVPYRLCLHHRDFLAGSYITESIMEAVAKSRRTIIVLSENFVQSEFCTFEFKMAHLQMLRDRRKRIILIILGNIPQTVDNEIKLYLKTNTYITWGDRLFWQKLYFALPEPRHQRLEMATTRM